MTHMQDDDQYHVTDEDIEKVLNLLKIMRPSKPASPEYARRILEQMYIRYHALEHIDPDAVEEIMKDLEEY